MPFTQPPDSHVSRVVSTTMISAGNVVAWVQSMNLGAVVTTVTVVAVPAMGLIIKVIHDWQIAMVKIRLEREALEAATLTRQIETLQAAVEADRARTEDANQKLHALRNEANTQSLSMKEDLARMRDEAVRLTKQLEITTGQLQEETRSRAALSADLEAARLDNKRLTQLIEATNNRTVANGRAIASLAGEVHGKSDDLLIREPSA